MKICAFLGAALTCLICVTQSTIAQQQGGSPEGGYTVCGTITNYRVDKPIYMAIYSSRSRFKARQHDATLRFTPDVLPLDSLTYCFRNIPTGRYMIAAFQDLDENGAINMGLFGPTEPYRVYRVHRTFFGPEYDRGCFEVKGNVTGADLRF